VEWHLLRTNKAIFVFVQDHVYGMRLGEASKMWAGNNLLHIKI
jgi:hypothetical protein